MFFSSFSPFFVFASFFRSIARSYFGRFGLYIFILSKDIFFRHNYFYVFGDIRCLLYSSFVCVHCSLFLGIRYSLLLLCLCWLLLWLGTLVTSICNTWFHFFFFAFHSFFRWKAYLKPKSALHEYRNALLSLLYGLILNHNIWQNKNNLFSWRMRARCVLFDRQMDREMGYGESQRTSPREKYEK